MKDIIFGAVVLILAGAVVLLFAMFGELTSRLPADEVKEADKDVWPLEDAKLGTVPGSWPAPLREFAAASDSRFLFVLSTACKACQTVATQVGKANGAASDIALVVSTANRENGEAFLRKYGVSNVPYYIDEKGAWVQQEFGIDLSPTALVFRDGALQSALVFQDIQALRTAAVQQKGVA
jgi:hypothetical protein